MESDSVFTELVYGELLLANGDASGARAHLTEAIAILAASPAGQESELARAQAALKRCAATVDR